MTSSFIENVKMYLLSQAAQDSTWYILVIPQKWNLDFYSKLYIEKSDIGTLNFLYLFYRLTFYLLEKRKKIWGHRLSYFRRAKFNPIPTYFEHNQYWYITLRREFFAIFIIAWPRQLSLFLDPGMVSLGISTYGPWHVISNNVAFWHE